MVQPSHGRSFPLSIYGNARNDRSSATTPATAHLCPGTWLPSAPPVGADAVPVRLLCEAALDVAGNVVVAVLNGLGGKLVCTVKPPAVEVTVLLTVLSVVMTTGMDVGRRGPTADTF